MTNAFTTAFQAAGMDVPASNSEPTKKTSIVLPKANGGRSRGEWGTSDRPNIVEWSHPNFGSIRLEPEAAVLGEEIHKSGPNTWCRLRLEERRANQVALGLSYQLHEGVELLYGVGDELFDTAEKDAEPFVVPIHWNGKVPQFPRGVGKVDFQAYLYNRKISLLAHVDNAIIAQAGKPYLVSQMVTGAQVIKHPWNTEVPGFTSLYMKEGMQNMTMIPYYDENCYSGFDPVASIERTYPGRTMKIFEYINKWGTAIDPDKCLPGQWQPQWPAKVPEHLAEIGFVKAVVRFFSLSMGWGFLELEGGEQCFAHFKQIQSHTGVDLAKNGKFAVLDGGTGVYVRPTRSTDGKEGWKAEAVRPLT